MTEFFGQEVIALEIGVPVGFIADWPGDAAPTDWMMLNGAALLKASYPALYAVLGTRYGDGDGSGSEFNLPDISGRVTVGVSPSHDLASNGGVETVTLLTSQIPAHTHVATAAGAGDHSHSGWTDAQNAHGHDLNVNVGGINAGAGTRGVYHDPNQYGFNAVRGSTTGVGAHSHNVGTNPAGAHGHAITVNNEGGGGSHDNMQPFLVMNKIIKVQ